MANKSQEVSLERRRFLKNSTGVVLMIGSSGILPQLVSCNDPEDLKTQLPRHELTSWVLLSTDGHMTIFNPASEMGQGSMTSMPALFAEEMDAEWDKVHVEFSPQESEIYGSNGWGPNGKRMLSAGSRVTKSYFKLLRKAGAQARHILMHSASQLWDVPLDELSTEPGHVIHKASNEKISYGALVPHLNIPEVLPEITDDQLKSNDQFRLIGNFIPRTDIPSKTNGEAKFACDVRLPGMLYGAYERGRVHGAKPTLNNLAEIEAAEGVVKVVLRDYAVGVIAETWEAAFKAKESLNITWDKPMASGFNSGDAFKLYEKTASNGKADRVVTDEGDVKGALRSAFKSFTSDYKNDYAYHAQMEPLNSVVQVADDGQSAEVWVGSQQGFDSKLGVPNALGLDPAQVKINLMYLGGGFGRRSMSDFVTECAILAKEVAPRPVKLLWTREDDLTYGAYRPMSLQRLRAGVDPSGRITALSHIVVGDGMNLLASGIKNDHYNIPNQHAEIRRIEHGIRLKHWRAVGHGPNKFAIEAFLDEIALDQKIDPITLRKQLMDQSPRALATLMKVEEMCGGLKPSNQERGRGVAFLERSGTLSTGICEISLDRTSGKIKVHHFWSAHDAGIAVQPENVKAQIEGGIVMGMSSVFKERISIEDGAIQQSNFHDYHLLRMEDVPDSIETAIIDSDQSPQGVGESGTPLVACAVANAFLALTGKKLKHLPFTQERVLEALNT